MFLAVLLPSLLITYNGLHIVPEGHVGIYYRGGALLNEISDPGYSVKFPGLTSVYFIQTTVQTDSVTKIPCGTSGGVMVEFDKVEVVNRLKKELVLDTVKNYTAQYD
jgi:hypothetical protein